MGLFPALLFALASRPQAATISCTCAGIDVKTAVAEISRISGRPLSCAPNIGPDVVVLVAKDAPVQDVMAKLAEATAGEWKDTGAGMKLVRSASALREEEKADFVKRAAQMEVELVKIRQAAKELPVWNEKQAQLVANQMEDQHKAEQGNNGNFDRNAWMQVERLNRQSPGGRAITRLLARFPARALAQVTLTRRIVFSSAPTALQVPMPAGVDAELQAIVREQTIWSELAPKIFVESDQPYQTSAAHETKPLKAIGKVLLCAQKEPWGGGSVSISLKVADEKGRIVMSGQRQLQLGPPQDPITDQKPEPGEKPITLAEPGASMLKSFAEFRKRNKPGVLPEQLSQLLQEPEKIEPISILTGPMIAASAEAQGKNFVAVLPDMAFFAPAFAGVGDITPSMVMKTLTFLDLNREESAGWVIVRPQIPADVRRTRADRRSISELMKSVKQEGRLSLDALARYAGMNEGDDSAPSLGMLILYVTMPNMDSNFQNWDLLRLYGLMSPEQMQAVRAQKPLPLSTFSDGQMAVLNRMLFARESYELEVVLAKTPQSQADWDLVGNNIRREATEMFAEGLPKDSQLVLRDETNEVVFEEQWTDQNGSMHGGQALAPQQMARTLFARERPEMMPWVRVNPKWDEMKFKYGKRRELNFDFLFGKSAEMQKQLHEDFSAGEGVPYAQLPQSYRAKVDEALGELRKSNRRPGDLGIPPNSNNPPPPARQSRNL